MTETLLWFSIYLVVDVEDTFLDFLIDFLSRIYKRLFNIRSGTCGRFDKN